MKLSPRLKAIADWIGPKKIVGDVGSDHGYLMTYLVEHQIIDRGIASDINEGPVLNCKKTVGAHGYENQIEVRLGGGLLPYKVGEIDTVVIAGMGGELIRDILVESDPVARSLDALFLQPMTGQDVLRKWLIDHGYTIECEKIVWEDNRCYEMLHVVQGQMALVAQNDLQKLLLKADLYEEIGYTSHYDEAYISFLDRKMGKYDNIMTSILKNSDVNQPKYRDAELKMTLLKEVKACIQTLIK